MWGVMHAHEEGYRCHESFFQVQKEPYARLIILIMLNIQKFKCIKKPLFIMINKPEVGQETGLHPGQGHLSKIEIAQR
jgi:hypothetical protein